MKLEKKHIAIIIASLLVLCGCATRVVIDGLTVDVGAPQNVYIEQ